MKKDLGIIFGLAILILVLLVFGKGFTSTSFLPSGTNQATQKSDILISIKNLSITAKVSASADDKKKGLSKVESLPLDRGMLFVFDKSGIYGFWMKDMKFAIDIIFIGEDKSIVDITENVPTETGKSDRDLTIYKPKSPVRYVLEINAGLSRLNNLQIGDKVDFAL